MKKRFIFLSALVFTLGLVFTSCGDDEPKDECSGELGNVQEQWSCSKPVYPQLCTVDGVDDHYVLDGVEYPCKEDEDGLCGFSDELVKVMSESYGCFGKKSAEFKSAQVEISKRAEAILANLKMESTLCRN